MPNDIQKELRAARRRHDIPQRELAEAVGLTPGAISYYELSAPPSPERAKQLFEAIERLAKTNKYRPELRVCASTRADDF
jgi:transcriptional regulator with XRE-family HTH domain